MTAPADLTIPNAERPDPRRSEAAVTSGRSTNFSMSFDSTSPIASEEVRHGQG